jgi:arabinosyltransferase C
MTLEDAPAEATAVRLVVEDNDLTDDGWIAVSAPRMPFLTQLTDRVGDKPVYIDWPASFVFPCIQLPKVSDGISEMPEYRITAGELAEESGWADARGGGPLGWIEEVAEDPEDAEVPSFLARDPTLPWGELLKVDPYEKGDPPKVVKGREVRPGWWSPGPGPDQPDVRIPPR